jgi:hypothetical protein
MHVIFYFIFPCFPFKIYYLFYPEQHTYPGCSLTSLSRPLLWEIYPYTDLHVPGFPSPACANRHDHDSKPQIRRLPCHAGAAPRIAMLQHGQK